MCTLIGSRLQVCGHKWADLSEYGFGVSVLNDNKYGWSCINNVLRLSLYVWNCFVIAAGTVRAL